MRNLPRLGSAGRPDKLRFQPHLVLSLHFCQLPAEGQISTVVKVAEKHVGQHAHTSRHEWGSCRSESVLYRSKIID